MSKVPLIKWVSIDAEVLSKSPLEQLRAFSKIGAQRPPGAKWVGSIVPTEVNETYFEIGVVLVDCAFTAAISDAFRELGRETASRFSANESESISAEQKKRGNPPTHVVIEPQRLAIIVPSRMVDACRRSIESLFERLAVVTADPEGHGDGAGS